MVVPRQLLCCSEIFVIFDTNEQKEQKIECFHILNSKRVILILAFFLLMNVVIEISLAAVADLRVFLFREEREGNSPSCKNKFFFFRPERYLRLETYINTNCDGELDKACDQSLPSVYLSIPNSSTTCFIASRSRTRSLDPSSSACNKALRSIFVNSYFVHVRLAFLTLRFRIFDLSFLPACGGLINVTFYCVEKVTIIFA